MKFSGFRISERPPEVPTMPRGLVELMEGLSRDVLKNNPTEVYDFCANHMRKLLEIRDGPTKNKPLSLEKKILKAQDKVRQRAEQRRRRFDRQLQVQSTQDHDDYTIQPDEKGLVVDTTLLGVLKPPVRHEQFLTDASEIEISHNMHGESTTANDNCLNDLAYEANDVGPKCNIEVSEIAATDETYSNIISHVTDLVDILTNKQIIEPKIEPLGETSDYASGTDVENEETASKVDNKLQVTIDIASIPENQEHVDDSETNIEFTDVAASTEKHPETISHVTDIVHILSKKQIIEPKIDSLKIGTIGETSNYVSETDIQGQESVSHVDEVANKVQDKTDTASMQEKKGNVVHPDADFSPRESSELIPFQEMASIEPHLNSESSALAEPITTEIKPERGQTTVDNMEIILEHNAANSPVKTATDLSEHDKLDKVVADDTNDSDQVEDEANSDNPMPIKPDTLVDITQKVLNKKDLQVVLNLKTSLDPSVHHETENLKADQESDPSLHEDKENVVNFIAVHHKSEEIEKDMPSEDEKGNNDMDVLLDNQQKTMSDAMKGDVFETNIDADKLEEKNTEVSEKKNVSEANNGDTIVIDTTKDAKEIELDSSQTSLIAKYVEKGNVDNDSALYDSNVQEFEVDTKAGNQSSMDLETAAITIQKVFRTFLFKSRASTFDDTSNDATNLSDEDSENNKEDCEYVISSQNLNMERRPLGITRMDTVLQTVNEEKSLSLSTDDSSTLSSAATTIQAHVRGFLVRNRLNSNKTVSSNSLVNSNTSVENDIDHYKNKTILNIHIVPEGGNLSRDESILTSMDLSLDASPPSSINLHPLGYDKSERRKLKREDAIQSISPPSNNSGKLSEESVKYVIINDTIDTSTITDSQIQDTKLTTTENVHDHEQTDGGSRETSPTKSTTPVTVINIQECFEETSSSTSRDSEMDITRKIKSLSKMSSDEMDVVTPFLSCDDRISTPLPTDTNIQKLEHSGELHDMVLPTKVSRCDTAVVREFKNVVVYFLLWNH